MLWIALAAIVAISALLLLGRARGAAVRVAALALILLALANPSFTREDREPLSSVAAVVIDKSPSQNFGTRNQETAKAQEALVDTLKKIKGLEVRVVEAGQADGETDGTKLFGALSSALSDVPVDRVAGAFLITDGRVHDIPANAAALGFQAPVHALVTGRKDERDRRIAISAAPRFGIVGQPQTITYRLDDQGVTGQRAKIVVRRDGEVVSERTMQSGQTANVEIDIKHAGPNIVEIEASPLENELTLVNNRAVVSIDGVRDKLRVLLVSGEPHSGERTWRNLLKSDASVDLVHFTILRPPEKQDGTPINELSLIAFPTRELFQQKINEFHLIIFDRYARQGVLPIAYFDNIARYVRAGGAVLVSAGPDYASTTSIWRTPLDTVLPAEPVGVTEKPFYAHLSDAGKRHPVTRGLEGSANEPPRWSRFFRTVDTRNAITPPVMTGADGKPLLLLSRFGEGRVALLLSDHIWLWARGFEGGGPHLDLLRRTSHWLMKQPDLDEEALRLQIQGKDLVVLRQTMADNVPPVTVTSPSGATKRTHADRKRPRHLALHPSRQRTRPLAGDRRHAESPDQCRADQSEGIFRSHLHDRDAEAAGAGDRRRRAARGRRRQHRSAPCGAGARLRHLPRRWLDGRQDARRQRRQGRRRAADVRRPDRAAAAARCVCSDVDARGALSYVDGRLVGYAALSARTPSGKRIGQSGPFLDVHSRFARNKARVEARLDRVLVHAGADEDDLLSAIAIEFVPVLLQRLPPERIVRPAVGRHIGPPKPETFGSDDRAGLTQFTQPLRTRSDPEMSLRADNAGPSLPAGTDGISSGSNGRRAR